MAAVMRFTHRLWGKGGKELRFEAPLGTGVGQILTDLGQGTSEAIFNALSVADVIRIVRKTLAKSASQVLKAKLELIDKIANEFLRSILEHAKEELCMGLSVSNQDACDLAGDVVTAAVLDLTNRVVSGDFDLAQSETASLVSEEVVSRLVAAFGTSAYINPTQKSFDDIINMIRLGNAGTEPLESFEARLSKLATQLELLCEQTHLYSLAERDFAELRNLQIKTAPESDSPVEVANILIGFLTNLISPALESAAGLNTSARSVQLIWNIRERYQGAFASGVTGSATMPRTMSSDKTEVLQPNSHGAFSLGVANSANVAADHVEVYAAAVSDLVAAVLQGNAPDVQMWTRFELADNALEAAVEETRALLSGSVTSAQAVNDGIVKEYQDIQQLVWRAKAIRFKFKLAAGAVSAETPAIQRNEIAALASAALSAASECSLSLQRLVLRSGRTSNTTDVLVALQHPVRATIGEEIEIAAEIMNPGTVDGPAIQLEFRLTGSLGEVRRESRLSRTPAGGRSMVSWKTAIPSGQGEILHVAVSLAGTEWSQRREGLIRVTDGVVAIAGPNVTTDGVVNAASYQAGPIAPGELVSVFGLDLGPNEPRALELLGGRLPTMLGGVRVFVGGNAAPIVYAGRNQLSVVLPYSLNGAVQPLFVVKDGRPSRVLQMRAAHASPALFTLDSTGQGLAAGLNQDYSVIGSDHPVPRDTVITLFGTGGGRLDPETQEGDVAGTDLRHVVLPVQVVIGGQAAEVLYAGSAPGIIHGVFQINCRVPMTVQPGNAVSVELRIGDAKSSQKVTIPIK